MILLVHDEKDHGMVALAESIVAGEPTPARHYHHQGRFLPVEAPANALEHDIAELQRLGYRLADAKEIEQHRKATALRERGEK